MKKQLVDQFYKDHANDPIKINEMGKDPDIELKPRYALYDNLKSKRRIKPHYW